MLAIWSFKYCFDVLPAGLSLEPCRPVASIPVGGARASKNGYIKSPSLEGEYLEMHRTHPRTPLPLRQHESPPLGLVRSKRRTKGIFPIVSNGHPPGMGQDQIELAPRQRGLVSAGIFSSAANEEHECLRPMKLPSYPAHTVPTYDGKKDLLRPQTSPLGPLDSPNSKSHELANPCLVKSRGKFPMMGIGQMLRKRNQTLQSRTEGPTDVNGHETPKPTIIQEIFYTASNLQPQCTLHSWAIDWDMIYLWDACTMFVKLLIQYTIYILYDFFFSIWFFFLWYFYVNSLRIS